MQQEVLWRFAAGAMALRIQRQMFRLMDALVGAGGFQEWIENMTDQSHVSWAHHSAAGNRCVLPACATLLRTIAILHAFPACAQEGRNWQA